MKTDPVRIFLLSICVFYLQQGMAQEDDGVIRTTDGHAIAYKNNFIAECKKMYGFTAGDTLVSKACECQASLLNNYFTSHQLSFYQRRYKHKALQVLIEQDVVMQKRVSDCIRPASPFQLAASRTSGNVLIGQCVEDLKKQHSKPVNDTLANRFVAVLPIL